MTFDLFAMYLGLYLLNKDIPNWLVLALDETKPINASEWHIYNMIQNAPGDSKELRSLILALVKDVK
jgi:hypothetical protein